jgi:hypothetical protein
MAFVLLVLGITQVSDVEDDLVSSTTGALASFADTFTFVWLLLVALFAVMALVGVITWVVKG